MNAENIDHDNGAEYTVRARYLYGCDRGQAVLNLMGIAINRRRSARSCLAGAQFHRTIVRGTTVPRPARVVG